LIDRSGAELSRRGSTIAIIGGGARALPAVIVALAALLVGCGNDDGHIPVACDAGVKQLRSALAKAPGEVRLEGDVRLSQCFTRAAQPSEIQQVGAVFLDTAEQLAARARDRPHSREALQLGYLIGAVRHGAGGTQGIHYEAQRRIEQELIGVEVRTPEFMRGVRAGARTG
jgi:hypothetical protein